MKKYAARLVLALLLPLVFIPAQAAEEFDEGFQYVRVRTPVEPVGNDAEGKIEVVELFWYGCGHCYSFEPHLQQWLQHKPDNVEFVRIPAIFNSGAWRLHARAYYTAEALGVVDKIHGAFFDAIHKDNQPLNNLQQITRFFAKHGVDKKAFQQAFNSFAVDMKVKRAEQLTERYGIDGVPAIVVAGKYRTDGPMAQSYKGMLQVTNHLLLQEQRLASKR